jgi:hypothetical protein
MLSNSHTTEQFDNITKLSIRMEEKEKRQEAKRKQKGKKEASDEKN